VLGAGITGNCGMNTPLLRAWCTACWDDVQASLTLDPGASAAEPLLEPQAPHALGLALVRSTPARTRDWLDMSVNALLHIRDCERLSTTLKLLVICPRTPPCSALYQHPSVERA
jgi:hypothetical protein